MSSEQLKAFLEKAKADASLHEKLKTAKSPDDVVGIAQEHGHEFSADKTSQLSKEEPKDGSGAVLVAGCDGAEGESMEQANRRKIQQGSLHSLPTQSPCCCRGLLLQRPD